MVVSNLYVAVVVFAELPHPQKQLWQYQQNAVGDDYRLLVHAIREGNSY